MPKIISTQRTLVEMYIADELCCLENAPDDMLIKAHFQGKTIITPMVMH